MAGRPGHRTVCSPRAQSQYDEAWSRPRFTLEQRTADLLLNAALALLFGSGMPLCYLVFAVYLVAADVCDRWALTRLSGVVPRYGKGLSRLVMGKPGRVGKRGTQVEAPRYW